MKKMTKKVVALGLATSMVFSMTACNKPTGGNEQTSAPGQSQEVTSQEQNQSEAPTQPKEIVKPEKITVMWDGTIFKEGDNYAEDFYKALSDQLGIEIEFIRPDHSKYGEKVGLAFANPESLPDVVILPSNYYAAYAAQGNLWDMTEAWVNSETYNSDRLTDITKSIVDTWYVAGPDGEEGIYGMYPARGNGCITYVNRELAEAAGYTDDTLPTTWAEYQTFLLAMKEQTGKAPVFAPGFITGEAPYVNYLPEFYQDAYPDFYFDEATGKWVDGFATDAMAAALDRLAWGVSNGLIDSATFDDKTGTGTVRDKFYEGDSTSVFTYWAGTWAKTITDKLLNKGHDQGVMMLKPIKETGAYMERLSPMICITSTCENPEGVFKYFIDTMLDGNKTQLLWQYGVEGVHYLVKEDGTLDMQVTESNAKNGKTGKTSKNLFEANLKIFEFDKTAFPNGDPGMKALPQETVNSFNLFNANSSYAPKIITSEEALKYTATLMDERKKLINAVAGGEMTGAEAVAKYMEDCGAIVNTVLNSVNN